MSHEIPFEQFAVCELCGEIGAFDISGDFICGRCIAELDNDYSPEPEEDEEDE